MKPRWAEYICAGLFAVFGLQACVAAPVNEYNLARTAVEAAKESEAPRLTPSLWHQASEAYRQGEQCYQKRDFECAKLRLVQARAAAEKAEDAARIQKFKTGDVLP
jgi:hypothetical protein